jgi:hypothetical protein
MKVMIQGHRQIPARVLAAVTVAASGLSALSLPGTEGTDAASTAAAVAELAAARYHSADSAAKTAAHIRDRIEAGAYDWVAEGELAALLTTDLRGVSGDAHYQVDYAPDWSDFLLEAGEDAGMLPADEMASIVRAANHGFTELRVLRGNVGYLKLDSFFWEPGSAEKAHAVMAVLADTEAIMIDLRENEGGAANMVQLLMAYFIDPDWERPLHTFTTRYKQKTEQVWGLPWVPGRRMPAKPVYILTSPATFSAAEILAYGLAVRDRALIVGERSGGGANAVEFVAIAGGFVLKVPVSELTDGASGTNWEGVGVKVDVECPQGQAVDRCHALALDHLQAAGR